MPERYVNLMEYIHRNIKICMGTAYTYTSQGVPQGLISSPELFNIVPMELLSELKGGRLSPFMFADDLAVLCGNFK
jgi:hypothetical protein